MYPSLVCYGGGVLGGATGRQPWEDRGCVFERMGLNRIKSDLKIRKIPGGYSPRPLHNVFIYYIHCTVRRFSPKSTFLDRTLLAPHPQMQWAPIGQHQRGIPLNGVWWGRGHRKRTQSPSVMPQACNTRPG